MTAAYINVAYSKKNKIKSTAGVTIYEGQWVHWSMSSVCFMWVHVLRSDA